jgi:NADH-quinone oxidoreductase subunit H
MISFEVPMVLTLLVPVLLARSMGINSIVEAQTIPFILMAPLAAVIFLICAQAELGRAPFDLAEAESEIVAGFHIEYSGMKFGMFYAGELLHALTFGALLSTLFLGGWRGLGAAQFPLLGVFWLFLKAFALYFVHGWIKYSLPRVRIDQMLNFAWKFLTPLSLALVVLTAVLSKVLETMGITLQSSPWVFTAAFLVMNILLIWLTVVLLKRYVRVEPRRVAEPRPVAVSPETPASEIS